MRLVDLSHILEDGMDAYPGLGVARFTPIVDHETSRDRYRGKAEFYLGHVDMPANTGTYLDSPFHRFPDGDDLGALPLGRVAGLPGIRVRVPGTTQAVEIHLEPRDVRGRAVVVETGRAQGWGTPGYWEDMPYLSTQAIDLLLEGQAALVAVDFGNVDDTDDPVRPAHTRLLEAGVLIVENLADPSDLPDDGFRFFAVPPRIVSGPSFPVRAFAEVE